MKITSTKDSVRIYLNGQRYEHWHFDDNYVFRDEDYSSVSIYEMSKLCKKNRAYIKGLVDSSAVMAGKYIKEMIFKDRILYFNSIKIIEDGRSQKVTDNYGKPLNVQEAAKEVKVPVGYISGLIDGSRSMMGIVKRGLVG